MFDMRAQPVLDVVVEPRETTYYLPNPEPGGNEPSEIDMILLGSNCFGSWAVPNSSA